MRVHHRRAVGLVVLAVLHAVGASGRVLAQPRPAARVAGRVVYRNVTIITPADSVARECMAIVVQGERITEAAGTSTLHPCRAAAFLCAALMGKCH